MFPSLGLEVPDGLADDDADEELPGLLLLPTTAAETPEELAQAEMPPGGDETKVISAHYRKKTRQ